jgi:hypothetical protein
MKAIMLDESESDVSSLPLIRRSMIVLL